MFSNLGGVVVNLDMDEVHAVGVFVLELLEDVHLGAAGGCAAVGGGGEGYEQGFGFVQGVGYGEAVQVGVRFGVCGDVSKVTGIGRRSWCGCGARVRLWWGWSLSGLDLRFFAPTFRVESSGSVAIMPSPQSPDWSKARLA